MSFKGFGVLQVIVAVTTVFSADCAWAQVGVAISSSLDQTASVTSKGARQSGGTSGPVALPQGYEKLLLAPGFMLQMSVFHAPEMDGALRVDDAGNIDVPLVGLVHVANSCLRDAEKKIESALLEKQILVNPHVTLSVTEFTQQPVVVAGEVQQPGKILILSPQPVLDLIASAGGVTTAAGGDIEIHHPKDGGLDEVQHVPYANGKQPTGARQALVYPGDTVYVRRAGVVYVLGAVNRPGGYLMVNGDTLTLSQAIALASGTSPVAASSTAVIVRKHGDSLEQLRVALKAQDQGKQAPFALQDGDMVYVPTSKLKSVFINSSGVLSAAASASIYAVTR